MTGEFCGRVATSARSTVIEYAPAPWPAVPGRAIEFNPPNWQPASSVLPATKALLRNMIRLIGPPLARPVRVRVQAGPQEPDPAVDRTAYSPGRERRVAHRSAMPAEPSGSAGPPGSARAHRVPAPSADPGSASAPWPA